MLQSAAWVDGRVTAGEQSGQVKRNLQVPEEAPEAAALGDLILKALAASPRFMSAALPLRVFPPLFNRYGEGMGFGDHIDNAIRISPASQARYRTDLSCTLFLTDPEDYDGGELVIGEDLSAVRVKLPAGDMALYPATTVHRVEPITRGERWAVLLLGSIDGRGREPARPALRAGSCDKRDAPSARRRRFRRRLARGRLSQPHPDVGRGLSPKQESAGIARSDRLKFRSCRAG